MLHYSMFHIEYIESNPLRTKNNFPYVTISQPVYCAYGSLPSLEVVERGPFQTCPTCRKTIFKLGKSKTCVRITT